VKARLQRLALRFDALALRERIFVFAGAAAVLVFLANFLIIERQSANQRQLKQAIDSQNLALGSAETQIKLLQQALSVDIDAVNREHLQAAQAQLSQLESQLNAAQKSLVSAELMPALLQEVLHAHQGLKLIRLRTLPVTAVFESPVGQDDKAAKSGAETAAPATGEAAPGGHGHSLYKHGFELTVQGSYPDFVQYLAQLERLPKRMYWGKVVVNADDYPHVTLTATIYTLSLDKAWLSV
jgi:MSHA biogenesis protein MshJ